MEVILYFSHAGEAFAGGKQVQLTVGNTAKIAQQIHQKTQAPLLEIQTVVPYPQAYQATLQRARQEKEDQTCPAILPLTLPQDVTRLYLGFPNWYRSLPLAVVGCLKALSLDEVEIVPFCTHEGSGFGTALTELASLLPDNPILKEFSCYGSKVDDATTQAELLTWLKTL